MIATGVLANGSIEAQVTGTTTLHGPTAGTMRGTASSSNNKSRSSGEVGGSIAGRGSEDILPGGDDDA